MSVLNVVVDNGFELTDSAPQVLKKLYESVFKSSTLSQTKVLHQGQHFFSRHSSDILLLLGFLSLPYCYAAANGAEVLVRSRRILEEPENRLAETAQFVFDVTAANAFERDGKGLATILKVRLIHAATRHYLQRSKDWSEAYGRPVNQEDMAGTNLSFSLLVVRGLRKLGKRISAAESLDYIWYWNLIGGLLGLRAELQPNSTKEAYLLERNIRQRQFRPSEAGKVLTGSLLRYFDQPTKGSPLENKSRGFMHFLLGDRVSAHLGLDVDPLEQRLFWPLAESIKLRNLLTNRDDKYAVALRKFQKQRQQAGTKTEIRLR